MDEQAAATNRDNRRTSAPDKTQAEIVIISQSLLPDLWAQVTDPGTTPPPTQAAPPATDPPGLPTTNADGSMTLKVGTTPPDDNRKMFDSFVPDEFRAKEWVQNIAKAENPRVELFKQIEHKDSLIGKQMSLSLPGDDATPEQKATFRKAIGIPDSVDEYKYDGWTTAEGDDKTLAEQLHKARSPEYIKSMAAKAHEIGLTPKQFATLAEEQDKYQITKHKADVIAWQKQAAEQDQATLKRATEIFGNRLPQVQKNAEYHLQFVPENVKPLFANATPEMRIGLAAIIDSIHQRYVKEDNINTGNTTHSGSSVADMRKERLALMQLPAASDMGHPQYGDIQKQIKDLNSRMTAASK